MRSWGTLPGRIGAPRYSSAPAKEVTRFRFASMDSARAPIRARGMSWPRGPKLVIALVVQGRLTLLRRRGTGWESFRMKWFAVRRCGVKMGRGRRGDSRCAFTPSRQGIPRSVGAGLRSPSVYPAPSLFYNFIEPVRVKAPLQPTPFAANEP